MTAAVLQQLAMAGVWTLAGVIGTVTVQMFRRDRAKAAREDTRVAEEFGPTLARWRAANELSRHLRPTWLPAATRSVWSRLRSAARSGWAWLWSTPAGVERLIARLQPSAAPPPAVAPQAPPVWAPAVHPERNVNTFTWPTNPAPQPTPAPVGRVPMTLDFDPQTEDFGAWVRGMNARLHHEADLRLADPDATGLIPVQSGVPS